MAGYLDVEAVWRPVLTSTKEPLREGVAVLIEQRALSTFIRFVLLPFQPFTHLLFLFFSLFTVITPALPSVARGVAGQNHSLIWICRECEKEEDYSLTVSVETLGCKQPAPCMSLVWQRGKEASLWGILCVCEVRPSIFKMNLQQLQIRREETSACN